MGLYIVIPYKCEGMGSRFLLVLYPRSYTGPILGNENQGLFLKETNSYSEKQAEIPFWKKNC